MIGLVISAAAMSIGAFFDGYSTVRFLKKKIGYEADPLMVWIYGSKTPPTWKVWAWGTGLIAAEIVLAIAVTHLFPHTGILVETALGCQAAYHAVCTYLNFKL